MGVIGWIAAAWLLGCLVIVRIYRGALGRLWREPVFRVPLLVLESDDWGAGPPAQAAALDRLADLLGRHRDGQGGAPVLTLAVTLAVPDGAAMRGSGCYRRKELDHPEHEPVRAALLRGEARGVFRCELHGHEHYWPAALTASRDPRVQTWLLDDGAHETEQLPSHLQSRWVDAATLPSQPLPGEAIRAAVRDEVAAYRRIMGRVPPAVVPPTFVWTREVEAAWAVEGLECVVTPGERYTRRNAQGEADRPEGPFINGQRSGATRYVVRTDYFEPKKGRDAAHALAALDRDAAQGRPCVLENHRDNFCRDDALRDHAEAELDRLLAGALRRHPALRFVATPELFAMLRERDPRWIVTGWRERLPFFWQRLRRSGRLWKLLRWSGMAAIAALPIRLMTVPLHEPPVARQA